MCLEKRWEKRGREDTEIRQLGKQHPKASGLTSGWRERVCVTGEAAGAKGKFILWL